MSTAVGSASASDQAERSAAVTGAELTLAYGSRRALEDATFTLPDRALTILIGPNGSGKSTLMNAITGLLLPWSGRIEVFGEPPPPNPADVAYVLQATKADELLPITVKDVVTMGRFARRGALGRLRAADRRTIDEAMERLEIQDLADRRLSELSGGQRQRALVAQGLAQQARLLLLDEPLTGFDLVSRRRILSIVFEEKTAGRAVVLASHDLEDAALADHVLLLAGRVVAEGTPREALAPDLMRQAYGPRLLRLDDQSVLLDDHHHHGFTEREPDKPPDLAR